MNIREEISRLKKEKDAVILAHYYQRADVQALADYVGDSFYLAEVARDVEAETIVFCGVRFMAESAKILAPNKRVLFPVYTEAPCCMEYMATPEGIIEEKAKYKDVKVVTYVNSSSAVKAVSDVCCTSSSVEKIVNNLDCKNILFVPDRNLGSYVAEKIRDKNIISWDGCCNIHDIVKPSDIEEAVAEHGEDLLIAAHPECKMEVRDMSHYVGSTSGILKFVKESNHKRFLIVTEVGIKYQLKKENPEKELFFLPMVCKPMKKAFPETILESLAQGKGEVFVEEKIIDGARRALDNMLDVSRKG